ncbi:YopX family protein [Enterococcus sp. AZ154]|uniref:YopX family protein n=1 Tax=Enterococcus sp. AZ154 TaxID=2774683 RepID=UPI003D2C0271
MVPKFRAWDKETQSLRFVLVVDWLNDLVDLDSGLIERQFDEVEIMQSTGLKDKNGLEQANES